jgi:ArsR family transcriptional regulator
MAHGAKSVSELTVLGGASQSQVSQFLRQMKADGLVSARRDGKFVYYKISNPKVEKLIKALRQICGA